MPNHSVRPETSAVPVSYLAAPAQRSVRNFPRKRKQPAKSPSPLQLKLSPVAFLLLATITTISFVPQRVVAQRSTIPVYLDDSPEAWELFGRAADQLKRDNPTEAVRLYQRLLDDFGQKLVPRDQPITGHGNPEKKIAPENDHPPQARVFITARARVHQTILADAELLRHYRENSTTTAQKMLERKQYQAVYRQRFLTAAGYEAGLALAEQKIRQARFASALLILHALENHPDLKSAGKQQRRWSRLLALAALYANDPATYQRGLDELSTTRDGAADRLALQRLAESNAATRSDVPVSIDSLSLLEAPSLAEISTKPVWEFTFQSGPQNALAEKNLSPNQRRLIRESTDFGQFGNFIPTASADLILACDGISIAAIDRFDGRKRWQFPTQNRLRAAEKMRLRQGTDNYSGGPDLSLVATNGRSVFAVIHHAEDKQAGQRSANNQLVALEVSTGELRWSVVPSEIDSALAGSWFHGSPILTEGNVVVMVRSARQRLASEYLVAFDLQTGNVRWSQYLVSSPMPRSFNNLPPTKPRLHQGIIYLSSPHGGITALDAETGAVRWSRILEPLEPVNSFADIPTIRPFETSAPVWTPAGILLESARRDRILLLDPTEGKVRITFVTQSRSPPQYLLTDEHAVYLVGTRILMLKHDTLAELAPLAETDPNTVYEISETWREVFSPATNTRILGRVGVGEGQLIIPTTSALLLVNTRTNEITRQAWRGATGNPLVIGAEVLIATSEGIDSYLPYAVAEPRLRARLAENPANPAPAISLARLAGRHRIYNDILPAFDRAIAILNQDPFSQRNQDAQAQLFATLLELANDPTLAEQPGVGRRPHPTTPNIGERRRNTLAEDLFVRLDLIAFSIPQRLEYLFSLGAFLARENQPAQAVNAYQEILTTPLLADGFFTTAQRRVRAETEATHRLTELIKQHGTAIYALQEAAARQALAKATLAPTFAKFMTIIEQYPLAHAAGEACLEAGSLRSAESSAGEAIFAWRLGLERNPTPAQRGRLLAELLAALEFQGQVDGVLHELRAAEYTDPDTIIITAEGTTHTVKEWRNAFLERVGPFRRFPRLGSFDENTPARAIKGDELLLPLRGRPSPAQALVRTGRIIKSYGGSGSPELWQTEVKRAETDLLVIDGETAILWGQDRRFPLYCEQISLFDGGRIWHTNLWGQPENPLDETTTRPFARPEQRRGGRIEPALGLNEIIFATMAGDVVCVDRNDGAIRWTRANLLPEIAQAITDPFGIVIAGQREPANLESSAVLIILDPETGRTITQINLKNTSEIRWLVGDGMGHSVVATRDAVIGYDLRTRKQRWRLEGAAAALGDAPQVVGGMIYVTDADDRLQTIAVKTGVRTPLPTLNLKGISATPPRSYAWDGRTLLKTSNGIYIFEHDGTRSGELARSGSSDLAITGVAIAEDCTVILETRANQSRRQLELYRIDHTGKRLDRAIQPDSALPKIDAAQAIDNWILVDAGDYVILIHAPFETNAEATRNP